MAQREVWQKPVTDAQGNTIEGASVTVFEEDGTTVATIYTSLTGGVKANPFTTSTDGLARFYAEPGRYVVRAQKGSFLAENIDVDLSMKALRTDLAASDSAVLVGGAEASEINRVRYTGNKAGAVCAVSDGNWNESGGRNVIWNPDAVDFDPLWNKNSVVVLGGRGDTGYRVTIGPRAELAFHGGGGNTLLDHLAGTICGGAHHKMTITAEGFGGHGFIGGGSNNDCYGDYAVIVGGTQNEAWATKCFIGGGTANIIGNTNDRTAGREAVIISGLNNEVRKQYGVIGSGNGNLVDGFAGFIPTGVNCRVDASYATARGNGARADLFGTEVVSNGVFDQQSDAQVIRGQLRRVIDTTFATQLTLDGGGTVLTIPTNVLWTMRFLVSAYRTNGADFASYEVVATVKRGASGDATILHQATNVLHETNPAWDFSLLASGGNLQARGTVASGVESRWLASFEIVQVRNL